MSGTATMFDSTNPLSDEDVRSLMMKHKHFSIETISYAGKQLVLLLYHQTNKKDLTNETFKCN